jgi:uncharacterized protein (TIGR02466 family)
MNLQPVFSSFLAEEILSIDCDQVLNYCIDLEKQRPSYHRNGWQSGPLSLDIPELSDLIRYIEQSIPAFAKLYGLSSSANPKITDLWINRNSIGPQTSFNTEPHVHANHWISFVFYPEANEDTSKLVLLNPNRVVEYAIPRDLIEQDTNWNCHRMVITPVTGLLIAFPSWVMHWIDQSPVPQDRYSIAINVTLSHINHV